MKRKRNADDLRMLIADNGIYDTHISFSCHKKKERETLALIVEEMDENGIGFKEALISLIFSDSLPEITPKPKRTKVVKQPKINNAKIDVKQNINNDIDNINKNEIIEKKEERVPIKEVESQPEVSQPAVVQEEKKSLSEEDKEALRKKLINSYKIT